MAQECKARELSAYPVVNLSVFLRNCNGQLDDWGSYLFKSLPTLEENQYELCENPNGDSQPSIQDSDRLFPIFLPGETYRQHMSS